MTKTNFKVYFEDEIRRLCFLSLPSLELFTSQLKKILGPNYDVETYRLQYTDEEGDRITVSSEPEWDEALLFQSSNPLKKFVLVKVEQPVRRRHCGMGRCHGRPPCFDQDGKKRRHHGLRRFNFLHRLALNFFEQKNYLAAKGVLEELTQAQPNHPIYLYNYACAESLLGNLDRAISLLRDAIQSGYINLFHLERDSDFDNIRHLPQFAEIVNSLKHSTKVVHEEEKQPEKQEIQPEVVQEEEKQPEKQEKQSEKQENQPEVLRVEQPSQQDPQPEEDSDSDSDNDSDVILIEHTYEKELKLLAEMGFLDEQANFTLLQARNGDLSQVISTLLSS